MNQFVSAFKKAVKQPGFMVAFVVLLLSAIGLNASARFLKLHFQKLPVEMAIDPATGKPRTLESIPRELGSWKCVSKDQLSEDMEQELGTKHYIMRYYIDSKVVLKEDIDLFDGATQKEALNITNKLRDKYKEKFGRAIISFAVTYYTGKADTVAHIPERCYTADGYEPTEIQTETWDLPRSAKYPDSKNRVRYISFEDQSGRTRVERNVAYFFNVNGRYEDDPLQVRFTLQNLFQKYGYYSKIELMIQDPKREESAQAMQDFLKYALPAVEECYPDFAKLEKTP